MVICCSVPQIFLKHKNTGTIEQLTPGGHCACPAYCEKTKKLAYIKIIDHVAQVLVYDYQTRKHTQLTFDRANKDECCWSPCGTYLAFVTRSREESRISIMNIPTGERWFLSPPGQRCSFPSWSLKYAGMPPCPQKNMNYSVSGLYS
jgi:Tol biopolymer transport system component